MNEIICPHCKKAFKVDESSYAAIVKQVRDHQFEEELNKWKQMAEQEKKNAVELAQSNTKSSFQEELSKKEVELAEIKAQLDKLKTEKELAVSDAVRQIEKERDQLANDVKLKEQEKELLAKSIEEQYKNQLIARDESLRLRDEEIARLKDYKQKLSTKMIGETLEKYCEDEFNKLRSSTFPKAYFEKDNDASGGTKGDFIYREQDEAGNEIISIMFEMKNEGDETATKKRNEDFFAKLDKDRSAKNCEYAVLVSL